MTRKLLSASNYRNISLVLFIIVAFTVFVSSCTKVAPPAPANAKFVGEWYGSNRCAYSNLPGDTIASTGVQIHIAAGTGNNDLVIGVWAGFNNCYKASYMNGAVNDYNISIPIQYFTDNCGVGYSIGGDLGTISTNGTTLTMTNTELSGNITTTCIFSLVKQ